MPGMLRLITLLTLAACTIGATATAQPVRLPTYGARQATDAVRIDGTLDEATWALSPRVSEMRLIHAPDGRPAFPTEAAHMALPGEAS